MPHRLAITTGALIWGAAHVLSGCHAKTGDSCTESPSSCASKDAHLVCADGKYVLEACRGPRACTDDKELACDNTTAQAGDGCGHDGARACSSDGAKELRCRGHEFAVEWSCRGGCTLDANENPKCTPTGEIGDACRPNSIVCDSAQRAQLDCVDGKLALARSCDGSMGCRTEAGGAVRCDRSQAVEHEDCGQEGAAACDAKRHDVLVCDGSHFRTSLHCQGPLGCELPGNYSVRCDKSLVDEGEECSEEGALSCSPTGKQVKCVEGRFVLDTRWAPRRGETCSNHYRVSFETEKFQAR